MKTIQIGKSQLHSTQLGLGCINFGTTTDDKAAFSLVEAYLESGGNLLDTSNNYAFWNSNQERDSEKCIGRWLTNNQDKRKDFILSTKLGALPKDISRGFNDMQGTSRKVVYEEVEKSLEALQTDYIDLLYLHIDDYQTPLEETLSALADMINKGYVKNIGCSNFRTWRIEKARQICKENNYPFFCAVQQRYSYLQPVIDADFGVQICGDNELKSYIEFFKDMTFVAHTSLLYGAYQKNDIQDINYDTLQNRQRLEKLSEMGKDKIPWVLDYISKQYGGSIALFTSANLQHLKENIEYFNK